MTNPQDDLNDAKIEAIHEAAHAAAEQSSPYQPAANPHPPSSQAAEIWDFAYRQALANTWH